MPPKEKLSNYQLRLPGLKNDKQFKSARLDFLQSDYGLSSEDFSLIEPLFYAGASDRELLQYISDLRAGHLDEDKNSLTSHVGEQRALGLNPDLTGVGETGETSTPRFEPLPSQGGSGTISDRARSVVGSILQIASFAISAYGTISGAVAKDGLALAGVAASDIASVVGDESGKVTDVPGFISQMISQHGFSGKKARQYAQYVSGRINAFPIAIQRLKNQKEFQSAQSALKLETYKNSAPFIEDAQKSMKLAQDLTIKTHELDLKEKQMKLEFLEKHPEYTEETLNAELNKLQEESRKATADANLAEANVTGKNLENQSQVIQNATESERLEQMKDDNETKRSDNEVKRLKNDLIKIELDGIDAMIEFCRAFEDEESSYFSDTNRDPWHVRSHVGFLDQKGKSFRGLSRRDADKVYKHYKKLIREHYLKKDDSGHFKISTNGVEFSK